MRRLLAIVFCAVLSLSAQAQWTGVFNPMMLGPGKILLSVAATPVTNTGSAASFSFTAVSLGTEAVDRDIVVTTAGSNSANGVSVSSITIGGNTATIDESNPTGGTPDAAFATAIARLRVPAGTTATIAVNFSAAVAGCNIVVYRMTGSRGVFDNKVNTAQNAGASLSINTAAGGATIGDFASNGTTPGATTWSGLTEDTDANFRNSNNRVSTASASTAAGGSLTVSATPASPGAQVGTLLAVSYRP